LCRIHALKSIDPTSLIVYNKSVAESRFCGKREMLDMVESSNPKEVERRNLRVAMILLPAVAAVSLYAGVMAGLHSDWMRMSLSLFTSVLMVFFAMMGFIVMRLKDRLTRLEDRFQIGHEVVPRVVRRVEAAVAIFAVLSIAGHMTLSVVGGFRANWFRMGIHLTACAISVVVCTGILAGMSIGRRMARLEQLPAGTQKAENV